MFRESSGFDEASHKSMTSRSSAYASDMDYETSSEYMQSARSSSSTDSFESSDPRDIEDDLGRGTLDSDEPRPLNRSSSTADIGGPKHPETIAGPSCHVPGIRSAACLSDEPRISITIANEVAAGEGIDRPRTSGPVENQPRTFFLESLEDVGGANEAGDRESCLRDDSTRQRTGFHLQLDSDRTPLVRLGHASRVWPERGLDRSRLLQKPDDSRSKEASAREDVERATERSIDASAKGCPARRAGSRRKQRDATRAVPHRSRVGQQTASASATTTRYNHSRGVESILRIDYELQPLNIKLSRLLAEFRAMNLSNKGQIDEAALVVLSSKGPVPTKQQPLRCLRRGSVGGFGSGSPTQPLQQRLLRNSTQANELEMDVLLAKEEDERSPLGLAVDCAASSSGAKHPAAASLGSARSTEEPRQAKSEFEPLDCFAPEQRSFG
uniref:Uncharacterized protein n=1 Tax=Trichogramma kaykai TaxID=54128 RepID=A0ABD2WRB1_9HYME